MTRAYINSKLDKIHLKEFKIYQPPKNIKINEGHGGRQVDEYVYSNDGNESGSLRNSDSDCSSNGSSISSNNGDSTFSKRDEDGYKHMDIKKGRGNGTLCRGISVKLKINSDLK